MYTHYKLDDGRFWDIERALFVSDVSSDDFCVRPIGEDGQTADEAGLYFCLKSFGYPLGELKKDADYASEARAKRDALLAETDFMMMPDYPLSEAKRAAVAAYRQFLRDIPEQSGFPRQINWPLKTF